MGGVFGPQNLNGFGYVHQNPVKFTDPDGASARGNTLNYWGSCNCGPAERSLVVDGALDLVSGGTLALKDPFVVPGLFGMMASGQAMVSAGSSINAMDAKNPPAPPVASQSSAVAGAPQGNGPNDDEDQNNQNEKETRPTDRYKENLDQRTLDAARRELRGETVRLKSGGDAYDHITESRERSPKGVAK